MYHGNEAIHIINHMRRVGGWGLSWNRVAKNIQVVADAVNGILTSNERREKESIKLFRYNKKVSNVHNLHIYLGSSKKSLSIFQIEASFIHDFYYWCRSLIINRLDFIKM